MVRTPTLPISPRAALVARGVARLRARAEEPVSLTAQETADLLRVELWPHQGRILDTIDQNRETVLALGRRSGKTTMAAIALVQDALFRPAPAGTIGPGEPKVSAVVATGEKQASQVIETVMARIRDSPEISARVRRCSATEIVFDNGSVIRAYPASARRLRGFAASMVYLDEAAHMLETNGNASAERIYAAAQPLLAQFAEHGRMIVSSTPYGTQGLFAERFRAAVGDTIPGLAAIHLSTFDVSPLVKPELLEETRERKPFTFRSEYLAEFVSSGDRFIEDPLISAATTLTGDLPPTAASRWWMGIDPGFSQDSFGVVVVGISRENPRQYVVGAVRRFRAAPREDGEIDVEAQLAIFDQLAVLARRYGVTRIATDQAYERLVAQSLRERHLRETVVRMDASTKSDVYLGLRLHLLRGELLLPDDPELLTDLESLRSQVSPGKAVVSNPRRNGSHGDLAQALAVALHIAGPLRAPDADAAFIGVDPSSRIDGVNDYGVTPIPEAF